jgi:osmotically-inducible protein OsmY
MSVSTTNGRVTLTSTVPSTEAIGRAVMLVMGTAGVQEVVSIVKISHL